MTKTDQTEIVKYYNIQRVNTDGLSARIEHMAQVSEYDVPATRALCKSQIPQGSSDYIKVVEDNR